MLTTPNSAIEETRKLMEHEINLLVQDMQYLENEFCRKRERLQSCRDVLNALGALQ
jgi:hypothetical protein